MDRSAYYNQLHTNRSRSSHTIHQLQTDGWTKDAPADSTLVMSHRLADATAVDNHASKRSDDGQ